MSQLQIPNIRELVLDKSGYMRQRWWSWLSTLMPAKTFTGTITTAKLTGGGANGSMTFQNGVLVSQVAAT